MEIINLKLSEIKPYEKNAKLHPEEQIDNIAKSISQFGFVQPIVVDEKNVIIIGHGRYYAAQKLKLESVPVIKIANLNEKDIKKLRIIDNKTNESLWNVELLKEELENLDFSDFDFNFDFAEKIDWDDVGSLDDYTAPEQKNLKCPKCGHVDNVNNFKKV